MQERCASAKKARHDLANLLTIAQASVEGMIDGVVPVTEARLNRLCDILSQARLMLNEAVPDANE